jgi:hypothetical protein
MKDDRGATGMRSRLSGALPVAVLLLAGCYTYVPATGPEPERGTAVRARLARPVDVRMRQITANGVAVLDGEVVRFAPDTLYLAAVKLTAMAGNDFLGYGETVWVPRPAIALLEERRLDRPRTGLAVAGALLVAALAHFMVSEGINGPERRPPGTQPR